MKVQFEEMFPWELAQAIAEAPICYLPLGVLEWHGEHNVIGLDAIKAHAICIRAAQQSGGVVVPPLYWATDYREDLRTESISREELRKANAITFRAICSGCGPPPTSTCSWISTRLCDDAGSAPFSP